MVAWFVPYGVVIPGCAQDRLVDRTWARLKVGARLTCAKNDAHGDSFIIEGYLSIHRSKAVLFKSINLVIRFGRGMNGSRSSAVAG